MNNKKFLGILGVALLTLTQATSAQDSGFRFLATGDLPYSLDQDVRYRRLLKQSESEDFTFLMHVGDFKAQSAPCSDDEFRRIRDLFRAYPKPVVYTPGDNEWTDCHGVGADPVERLDRLRDLFFKNAKTLRLDQMNAQHQSLDPKHSTYVENYRFFKSGVLFIVVHVVGSGNNYRADHAPSMKEFKSRNAANLAFMKESFAEAIATDAPGVVVVIHANPCFDCRVLINLKSRPLAAETFSGDARCSAATERIDDEAILWRHRLDEMSRLCFALLPFVFVLFTTAG